jgi:hypothetical protein
MPTKSENLFMNRLDISALHRHFYGKAVVCLTSTWSGILLPAATFPGSFPVNGEIYGPIIVDEG